MMNRGDLDHPADRSKKLGWGRIVLWLLLSVHSVLVLPAVYVWLTAASQASRSGPDANIGAGLVGLYLLAVGLPWTLLLVLVDLNSLDTPVRDAVLVGLPVLNLALHAALLCWTGSRHRVRPTGT